MFCRYCGQNLGDVAGVCPYCGTTFSNTSIILPRSGKPTAAGILTIIGGCLNVLAGIYFMLVGLVFKAFRIIASMDNRALDANPIESFMNSAGVVMLVAGVLGIISAVFILKRRYWGLGLAGAILTLIAGWVLWLPSMLGGAAIILVSLSHKEFS